MSRESLRRFVEQLAIAEGCAGHGGYEDHHPDDCPSGNRCADCPCIGHAAEAALAADAAEQAAPTLPRPGDWFTVNVDDANDAEGVRAGDRCQFVRCETAEESGEDGPPTGGMFKMQRDRRLWSFSWDNVTAVPALPEAEPAPLPTWMRMRTCPKCKQSKYWGEEFAACIECDPAGKLALPASAAEPGKREPPPECFCGCPRNYHEVADGRCGGFDKGGAYCGCKNYRAARPAPAPVAPAPAVLRERRGRCVVCGEFTGTVQTIAGTCSVKCKEALQAGTLAPLAPVAPATTVCGRCEGYGTESVSSFARCLDCNGTGRVTP